MDRKILLILVTLLFVLPCVSHAGLWSKAKSTGNSAARTAQNTIRTGHDQVGTTIHHPIQTAQQGAQTAQQLGAQGAQTVQSAVHSVSNTVQSGTARSQAASGKFKSGTAASGKMKTTP